jgi:hypothetical protein
MPNRTVREALLHSERYHAIGIEARLIYIELLLAADDYALLPISHVFLRMRCPTIAGKSPGAITSVLDSLVDVDLLRLYSVKAAQYAFIPRYGNWPKAIKPKWPVPPETSAFEEFWELVRRVSTMIRTDKFGRKRIYAHDINDLTENADSGRIARAYETETETETETEKTKARVKTPKNEVDPETGEIFGLNGSQPIPKPAKKNGALPHCPYDELVTAYREILPELPDVVKLSPNRKQAVQARWRDVCATDKLDRDGGLAFFRDYFRKVRNSRFLMGKAPPRKQGEHPFRATFEFLFREEKFLSVLEDKYDDDRRVRQ